jgi:hypothetical protein
VIVRLQAELRVISRMVVRFGASLMLFELL